MVLDHEKKVASGFTLVEMAIVLVIIGIILAGVMKGRDIVRGSQVKQFSQQFAQKWGTIAQTYYDKTGQQLLDGPGAGGGGILDGHMDANLVLNAQDALDACESVGITPCTMVKSKLTDWTAGTCSGDTNIVATLIDGEYTGTSKVIADLVYLNMTAGTEKYRRNTVLLMNVPVDVAKGLDTAIDGQEDGESGSFLCVDEYDLDSAKTVSYFASGNDATATAWPDADNASAGLVTTITVLDY